MNIKQYDLKQRNCTLMNIEMDDNYHIWKIKLQLVQQGNSQALQDIKSHCFNGNKDFSFVENNLYDALKNSEIKYIQQKQSYGDYQLFSQVPIFLLLQGQIEIKCINLQGDEQVIQKIQNKGVLYLSKQKIASKFGQSNVNIVTKFHLSILKNSTIIEIKEQSRRKIQNGQKSTPSLVGLREQTIMKKYMIFPLKYIRMENYDPQAKCEEKFYILEGRACYFYSKGKEKHLLAVFQQGYINPKQFSDPDIKLYVFQNTKILIFEEEFMRDDVVAGLQRKRTEHINALIKAYSKLSAQEKKKIQIKLINNYKLSKKEVDRQIFGIVQKPIQEKQSSMKKMSAKNELISTSSSMKEKCRIRISKKKKVI